jgi:hypothetical protein
MACVQLPYRHFTDGIEETNKAEVSSHTEI